jgi:hypothetical protein
MTIQEVPLQNSAQKFSIELVKTVYNCTVTWNSFGGAWILDIATAQNTPLVTGIPIVTGCDLLKQFPEFDFGGKLVAQTDFDQYAIPTYDNLGIAGKLYFITN